MNKDSKFAKRDDCDLQHQKIEDRFDELSKTQEEHGSKLDYIVGKVDGMSQQKNTDVGFFAMLIAFALGVWNLIVK